MSVKRHEGHKREIPNAHIYHAILPIIFFLIWFLDSSVFKQLCTISNSYNIMHFGYYNISNIYFSISSSFI